MPQGDDMCCPERVVNLDGGSLLHLLLHEQRAINATLFFCLFFSCSIYILLVIIIIFIIIYLFLHQGRQEMVSWSYCSIVFLLHRPHLPAQVVQRCWTGLLVFTVSRLSTVKPGPPCMAFTRAASFPHVGASLLKCHIYCNQVFICWHRWAVICKYTTFAHTDADTCTHTSSNTPHIRRLEKMVFVLDRVSPACRSRHCCVALYLADFLQCVSEGRGQGLSTAPGWSVHPF